MAEANVIKSSTEVNDPNAVIDEVKLGIDDIVVVHRLNVDNQTVEVSTLDEGWQEAYSKGRSGNGAGRKFRQRQSDPMNKRVSLSRNLNGRQNPQQQYTFSPLEKTTLRPSLSKSSSRRTLKSADIDVSTNTTKPQLKASGSAAATTTTLASKSLSYKEVALAPPGTVLKPILEKLEQNLERTETQIYRISSASSTGAESKTDTVMLDLPIDGTELPCEKQESQESVESVEKSTSESEGDLGSSCGQNASEISRRKLSAAAEPYNPGGFLVIDPQSSAATTYNSQIMVAEPISWAGVSCGIHSPPYYSSIQSNVVDMTRTMNPDAPEFVPRRSVQNSSQPAGVSVDSSSCLKAEKNAAGLKKGELARQILLSFIVKSTQTEPAPRKETKPKAESRDTTPKESTVTEIVYSREEESGAKANETSGGEGFVTVAKKKRRKNKQRLTNDDVRLYHQPSSVCA